LRYYGDLNVAKMDAATFETDLSLFKYDNLEQLPPAYRDLD
jgi:quinolinate synthase